MSARDELRQTIAILGWQEHRRQKERLCNFGHLHHGGLQSGRVTCAMGISQQLLPRNVAKLFVNAIVWVVSVETITAESDPEGIPVLEPPLRPA